MVCRATTLVKIVCADKLRIRRSSFRKTHCQAASPALMACLAGPIVADRAQELATMWRPRITVGLAN